jgi:hypothetical protein
MKDEILKSRRQILTAAGVGAVAALAGCSENGSDGEGESSPEEGNQSDTETQTEQTTESTPDQESTTTSTETSGEDQIHTGEEELENYMSSVVEDGRGGLGETEYHWIEFEQVENSLDLDFPDGMEYAEIDANVNFLRAQSERGYNTAYFALEEPVGEETEFVAAFLVADDWDEEATVAENAANQAFYSAGFTQEDEDVLQTLFDENILSYDDVSEGFPQEYLDLVD